VVAGAYSEFSPQLFWKVVTLTSTRSSWSVG